jgi:hypothetical protein
MFIEVPGSRYIEKGASTTAKVTYRVHQNFLREFMQLMIGSSYLGTQLRACEFSDPNLISQVVLEITVTYRKQEKVGETEKQGE